jgi:Transposase DDE domain group 1
VLDFDATDDPLHGRQEGAFFNGYYREYRYLPLYCFCGNIPLLAPLQDGNATRWRAVSEFYVVWVIDFQNLEQEATVIGKAEILPKGDNPRFIVTNLPKDGWGDRR